MEHSVFNPAAYKETTTAQWQKAAEAWFRWSPTLNNWLGKATDIMLDMAEVQPGHRVLDVAAGAGEQSINAAKKSWTERICSCYRHIIQHS